MGRLSWYKRDPNAALAGMMPLSLEERGAYNTVLDLIYAHDGCVADDDRFLSGWMKVDVRVWRRIRAQLLALEKLYVADGTLRNVRADEDVLRALARVASAEDAGRTSAATRKAATNKNNDLASTTVQRPFEPLRDRRTRELEQVEKQARKLSKTDVDSSLVAPPVEPSADFSYGGITIKAATIDIWKKAFVDINVEAEIIALSKWAQNQTDPIDAMGSVLAKKNREALTVRQDRKEGLANFAQNGGALPYGMERSPSGKIGVRGEDWW